MLLHTAARQPAIAYDHGVKRSSSKSVIVGCLPAAAAAPPAAAAAAPAALPAHSRWKRLAAREWSRTSASACSRTATRNAPASTGAQCLVDLRTLFWFRVADVRAWADPRPLAEELHPIVEPLRDADEVDTCQQARRSGIHGVVADVFERRRDPSAGGDAPALEVGERAHEAEHVARGQVASATRARSSRPYSRIASYWCRCRDG